MMKQPVRCNARKASRLAWKLVFMAVVSAKAAHAEGPIQDNSFLVEEAYNQEDGVVQHINTYQRFKDTHDWIYTFTQEWPVGGLTHQLSYTIPIVRFADSPDGRNGVGDIALNYRYQLIGDGEAKVAVAPRFSVIVPSGNDNQGRGMGTTAYQVNIPLSVVLTPTLVAHTNAGYTWTRRTETVNVGQSVVWLATQRFNFLLEAIYARTNDRTETAYVSPGIRWSYDFENGLQIVPGIAFPIGVGRSRGDKSVFLYLSFEHPFKKTK
jgi:hypothetical protein